MDIDYNIFYEKMKPYSSEDLLPIARKISDNKILLGISGKDSLAMWLYLREQGFEISPFAYYSVPGLSFFDDAIEYYQDFFKTKILTLPIHQFFDQYKRLQYQPPERAALIRAMDLPSYQEFEYEDKIARHFGLGENYLSAIGYRAADGVGRASFIRRSGPIGFKSRHYYFAIWDWKTKQVVQKIAEYRVKLSRVYEITGCTGDLFAAPDLRELYHKSREDYDRLKFWYPLIGLQPVRWYYVK